MFRVAPAIKVIISSRVAVLLLLLLPRGVGYDAWSFCFFRLFHSFMVSSIQGVFGADASFLSHSTNAHWRTSCLLLSALQPDVISFNTAITSCAKAGDWRRSLDLFAGMKVEGVTPDILSYNAVISACAKGGQWRIGLELLAKVLFPCVWTISCVSGSKCGALRR